MEGTPASSSGQHQATGWMRPKSPPPLPPPMSPGQIREAFGAGKALDPNTRLDDDSVYAMYEQQRVLEEDGSDLPVPWTRPVPYMPEPLPPSKKQTRGQVIVEAMSSTKDHYQNVDNPETQDKRRAEQFDAVLKNRSPRKI